MDFKFEFIDMYNKLLVGYIDGDKRKCFKIGVPEDIALKLFQITHPGLSDPSED